MTQNNTQNSSSSSDEFAGAVATVDRDTEAAPWRLLSKSLTPPPCPLVACTPWSRHGNPAAELHSRSLAISRRSLVRP